MSRVFTDRQAANLIWRTQFPDAMLAPLVLSDGRYALPEDTVNDRRHALYRPLLRAGTVETDSGLTFGDPDQAFQITVGGQQMYLSASNVAHAFTIPATGVFRYELHKDESGYGGDPGHGNRRTETISLGTRYVSGDTIWEAWSMVIGSQRAGLDMDSNLGLTHQWHSVDTDISRSPVFGIALTNGALNIYTRSDLNGPLVRDDHYSGVAPDSGAVTNFVTQGTLGEDGHLNVWMNGDQVVDVDTPIGYYNDPAGLAYPHWGMYMKNLATIDVLFQANIEWGTIDLTARIAAPTAVPVPSSGWV